MLDKLYYHREPDVDRSLMTWKGLLAVIMTLCLLMLSTPASAREDDIDDDLWLDLHPGRLKLRPYEEGEFVLHFRNAREEAVTVFVEQDESNYTSISDVEISPRLLEMGPGDNGTVTINIKSRATFFGVTGGSGVIIVVSWGPDLTVTDGSVDPSTVEGSNRGYYLTVEDDYYVSHPLYLYSFVVTVTVISALIIFLFIRSRARCGAVEVPGPEESRREMP
jgi:hypothetical protein